jgi:hypothetical protein
MIPDLDLFRSANRLVKQHGEDAPRGLETPAFLYAYWRRCPTH